MTNKEAAKLVLEALSFIANDCDCDDTEPHPKSPDRMQVRAKQALPAAQQLVDSLSKLKLSVEELASILWDATPTHCDLTFQECKKLFPEEPSVAEHCKIAERVIKALKEKGVIHV